MRETPEEMAELQRLFDRTMAKINPHFAAIVTPKRRLTAQQVCAYLQGTRIVAFSTVNAKGEPRVSPLDSLFLHGRFTLSTGLEATASVICAPTPRAQPSTSRATRLRLS